MWTFDGFPAARVNRELGTRVDQAWLDRVRAGAVKLGGCSASLVSPEGLILTNNHCVDTCKQQLSTPQRNYGETGFLTASRTEERRCPGMTAEFVTGIEDVTARVRGAIGSTTGQARIQARDAEIAVIEGACGNDPKLRCQVVDLYRGGQFKLYRFRKYDDVRLAFAPEDAIANFGGDPDNFSFPRFALDAAFVRVYEADAPAQTPNNLRWNASRPTAGAPVFVVGNPGATQRLQTLDQLRTTQDVVMPIDQLTRSELRGRLIAFRAQSPENAFIAGDTLYGVENSYKRARGQMRALTDARFMDGKRRSEAELRARVASNPALKAELGDPWADIAAVQGDYAQVYPAYHFLELRAGGGSSLYGWARAIVRGAQERAKPNGQRLPEFTQSRLPATQRAVLEARPVYPALDRVQLETWLSKTREFLTVDDPQVQRLLGRESPEALAERAVAGTKLGDPAERKRLWEGGLAAVQASNDPLIRLALAADADARAVRTAWDERVAGPTDAAAERIARARFAVYGDTVYPDATGTLRITYGRIEGWSQDGRTIGPFTTFAGLRQRATGSAPFVLPERWRENRADPATVFNMTLSTDTIGGSSGSPALNAAGEVIGANFDSTFLSQRNAFGYDPAVNRSVIVTAEAVTEALRDIYGQDRLVAELTGGR
ncbi:MAG: S46 family peptidase [Proteobacteria bacterium]|nr:S46 family peptidase [Pseudomonadota bacterium]